MPGSRGCIGLAKTDALEVWKQGNEVLHSERRVLVLAQTVD